MDELSILATRARTPRLGANTLRGRVRISRKPQAAARAASGRTHRARPCPRKRRLDRRPAAQLIAADRRWLEASTVRLIGATSPDYPPLLAATADAPAVLYVRSSATALATLQLTMVGSRNTTAQGRSSARSGYGASHAGALAAGGCRIAVCGSGLDVVYPREKLQLAQAIVEAGGALVSEYPPGTAPAEANFLRRYRIISGLVLGILVVEASPGGGSMHAARCAGEQGREVFASPGSIHSPLSHGCHQLIREGAKLVENAADVLSERAPHLKRFRAQDEKPDTNQPAENAPKRVGRAAELDKEYKILLDALGFEPASVNDVAERTGLPSGSVASMLLILELDGRIRAHPGGRYGRVHRNS